VIKDPTDLLPPLKVAVPTGDRSTPQPREPTLSVHRVTSNNVLAVDPPVAVRATIQNEMTQYAAGHRDAFGPLFEVLWPLVRSFTQRALGLTPDAEDAAQNTLLKVFARIAEFDPARDALGWALGIAYFEVRTLRRKVHRRREADTDLLERLAHEDPLAEEALISRQLHEALALALDHLTEGDRDVLEAVLREVDAEVGAPNAVVRKRRQRARDRLREIWRKIHGPL